jgi:hypothetical protein
MAIMNLLNGSVAQSLGAIPLLLAEGSIFAGIILISLSLVTGRRVYGRGAPIDSMVMAPAGGGG